MPVKDNGSDKVLPTGLVAFLISDVEGSTDLVQQLGDAEYQKIIEQHNRVLTECLTEVGVVVHVTGDSFFAVFNEPLSAITAAVTSQRRLAAERWEHGRQLLVRMGIHLGEGRLGGNDYVGLDVHRAARISSAAHGGQVLLSAEMVRRVVDRLPPDVKILELGKHRLKDLSRPEELFQLIVEGLQTQFPPVSAVAEKRDTLPSPATSFVGRSDQQRDIVELLDESRLVTLTGTGGTGKTRLAIQVASEVADRYADGAHFVDLSATVDEALIPATILQSVPRTITAADPTSDLAEYLREANLLLVLDNYEQLLPQSSVVRTIVGDAPDVRMIVTSRAPLHVPGEREYPVPPLPRPDWHESDSLSSIISSEAVQLFEQRAVAVNPGFRITKENAASVVRLVRDLDGLPLALELAASRVKLMTPEDILSRLSNRLLSNPSPDVPGRQRTIAGAIEWSYNLLEPPVQEFLDQFSVFHGGATFAEIESIIDSNSTLDVEALDALSNLVDHSLIEVNQHDATTRYQMLMVVREFALTRLTEKQGVNRVRDRHLAHFSSLAKSAAQFLLTSHQGKWLNALAVDHDNLRAAHDWAMTSGQVDLAHRMVGDLWRFWQRRGHLVEAEDRIVRTLATEGADPLARAKALEALGGVRYWRGDWAGAIEPYAESLEIVTEYGGPLDRANALYNAAFAVNIGGDESLARDYLEQSLELSRQGNHQLGIGRALWGLCDLSFIAGDTNGCIHWAKKAEQVLETLDAPFDLGWARFMIGHASYLSGDEIAAREAFDAALPLFIDAGDISALVLLVYGKSGIVLAEGDKQTAAYLLGAVDVLAEKSGARIGEVEANRYDSLLALREDPDPEIQEAISRGHSLTADEVIELAVST